MRYLAIAFVAVFTFVVIGSSKVSDVRALTLGILALLLILALFMHSDYPPNGRR